MPTLSEKLGYSTDDVVYELDILFQSQLLGIFAHGIYTAVYIMALYQISMQKSYPMSRRITFVLIITIMWALASLVFGINWRLLDITYVVYADTRESTFDAMMTGAGFLDRRHVLIISSVAEIVNILLAESIIIRRCWTVYACNWKVIALPCLTFTVEMISIFVRFASHLSELPHINTPNTHKMQWGVVHYSMTLFTNLFCTSAIIFRIIRLTGLSRAFRTYHGIIEILSESALLYTVIYTVYIGMYIHDTSSGAEFAQCYSYPATLLGPITGIAPALIIARVAAGHSRPNDSWMQSVSRDTASMHFQVQRPHSSWTESSMDIDLERPAPSVSPISPHFVLYQEQTCSQSIKY
ncbi:hypothetical protein CPB85DRAFT_1286486 [Mucidula mucida]|nr:hypothetical protein CPB85DRAFT_1286486 [Mucidula mucida]